MNWGRAPTTVSTLMSGRSLAAVLASTRGQTKRPLDTGLRQDFHSPIHDSAGPFDAVPRVFYAGSSGFVFHCVLSRQQSPQLTRPLAALWTGTSNLFEQI